MTLDPHRHKPLEFYGDGLPGVDTAELQGKLIVIEGPDAVGRSTQVARLKAWLEERGHAVLDTGMARSMLAGEGIQQAKAGHTFGPLTMTLFYATDFADRLENEIIPALRAGFIVLTDRYVFSMIARAVARGEDRAWIESVFTFALVPHVVYYLRAEVNDLVQRVVVGKGSFDYWESGMDTGLGLDMYESFVRYQSQILNALDGMAGRYGFVTVNASRPSADVFAELQSSISGLFAPEPPVAEIPAASD
jgi:dTMP kinase